MKKLSKALIATSVVLGSSVSMAEQVEEIGDTGWYQFVFGEDIGASITAGGDAPPLQGFDLAKRRHGYSASAEAEITMGCQGVTVDSVYQAQVTSHLTGLFRILEEPMGVVVAAGSYFMGDAYSVGSEVMATFQETFSWLTNSCQAAGEKLADLTVDSIPELAKYRCRDEEGGQESQCVGDQLNMHIQEMVSEYHDDAIKSLQSALASKVQNMDSGFSSGNSDRQEMYIKSEMDFFDCPSSGGIEPSYMVSVYTFTSMSCPQFIELRRLIGDVVVVDDSNGGSTADGSYQSTESIASTVGLQELFTEYSMAYGTVLYGAVRSAKPMETEEFERLTMSPGAGAISRAQLASLTQMDRDGEELMLAGRVRRLADIWAMKHIQEMLAAAQSNFSEYDARPNKPVDMSDNILSSRLEGKVAQLDVLKDFVEMRELERRAWRGE